MEVWQGKSASITVYAHLQYSATKSMCYTCLDLVHIRSRKAGYATGAMRNVRKKVITHWKLFQYKFVCMFDYVLVNVL